MERQLKRIAVIGAGPVGLEAALESRRRGHEVTIYESGRVAEHFRRYGDVVLFTPFRMNSTELGRAMLAAQGVRVPSPEALLSARDFATRYLEPLARLPVLAGAVREGTRVTQVAREGLRKSEGIVAVGDPSRSLHPFLLRLEAGDATWFERADIVLDASGVYGAPNATGPGGLPAAGEERLGDRIERHLPSILGDARPRYEGQRVLLIGDGASAATALVALQGLAADPRSAATVHWVHPCRAGDPFPLDPQDVLPARRGLAELANAAARAEGWLTRHPGSTALAYERMPGGAIRVRLARPDGAEHSIEVDRVLALVGYRPDTSLTRELHMHLCYASEGPMALASAILSASLENPGGAADCLSQRTHGADTLRNPEPGLFVLGAKSYGRNPNFLLAVGHQQIHDVLDLVGAESSVNSPA
jgi:hypothetical protein